MVQIICNECGAVRDKFKQKFVYYDGKWVSFSMKATDAYGENVHYCDECFWTVFVPALRRPLQGMEETSGDRRENVETGNER